MDKFLDELDNGGRARRPFKGFGPSILVQQMRGKTRSLEFPTDRIAARKLIREKCPVVPGVYGWLDENKQLAYVGKSKALRKRLLSYFAKNPTDNKVQRLRNQCRYIVWEPISHELLALIRETELIHRWQPEFNSMGQPTRMRPAFVCIGGSPAPNARLVRKLTSNYLYAFGPISGTKRLRQAVISLNQVFHLRDCPDKTKFEFQDQQFLFENQTTAKCIRYELGTCPGPCAGLCSSSTYHSLLDELVDFLNGNGASTLAMLEAKMHNAAERHSFETAAIYRDCLANLRWLDRRLNGLSLAEKRLNGVLPIEARRNRTAWIVLRGGRIIDTLAVPEKPEQAEKVLASIRKIASTQPPVATNLLEMSLQLIVISWFRKHAHLKKQLIDFQSLVDNFPEVWDKSSKIAQSLQRSA